MIVDLVLDRSLVLIFPSYSSSKLVFRTKFILLSLLFYLISGCGESESIKIQREILMRQKVFQDQQIRFQEEQLRNAEYEARIRAIESTRIENERQLLQSIDSLRDMQRMNRDMTNDAIRDLSR